MVFFVLSGFVISYVAKCKEFSLGDFISSRLARIYSVVVPALLLTITLDAAGSHINPQLYDGWWFESSQPVWRFLASLFLMNELWFVSIRPFSNGPFWSLGYEFWYYMLFGLCHYLKGKIRLISTLAIVLLIGPKVLLLYPVWWLGVRVFHFVCSGKLSKPTGVFVIVLSMIGFLLFRGLEGQKFTFDITTLVLGETFVTNQLAWSKFFLSSYIIAIFVAMNFIGAAACAPYYEKFLIRFEKPIRYCAGFSFSLYLMHYPCLMFLSAIYPSRGDLLLRSFVIVSASLFICWAFGSLVENKKIILKAFFSSILSMRKPN
jgi:peptidoglycan/LPS O-acetylase OafA/YrhL